MSKKKTSRVESKKPERKKPESKKKLESKTSERAEAKRTLKKATAPGKPASVRSRAVGMDEARRTRRGDESVRKKPSRDRQDARNTQEISAAPPRPGRAPAKPPARRMKASDLARIRDVLASKKKTITNHLQSELTELEKPEKRHRADLEEIASDTHDTDSLCEIMDIEATQIDQIDLALAKIENGTYGVCEDCGEEIPLVRLEALPFATQCIGCKRKAEIQGQISASDSAVGY